MSDATLDKNFLFSDAPDDWSRERPFQIALGVSVIAHALLITFVPGFRAVSIEPPLVLNVEIVVQQATPPIHAMAKQPAPKTVERPALSPPLPEQNPLEQVIARPQPAIPTPQAPLLRQPEAVEPRADFAPPTPSQLPVPTEHPVARLEPRIEAPPAPAILPPEPDQQVARVELAPPMPRPQPRPQPITAPLPEPAPDQKKIAPVIDQKPLLVAEPSFTPPAVTRVEPRLEPQILPRAEPRPEPLAPPPVAMPPQAQPEIRPAPVPYIAASEPVRKLPEAVVAPKLQPPAPVAVLTPAPPVAAPVPPAAPVSAPTASAPVERELKMTYSKQIYTQIKRFQKYPIVAQRRGWEGTAEVLVQISADGRITEVSLHKSSGRNILDEEALQMVRRASPLPQAPQALRGRKISITVPIRFRLQES